MNILSEESGICWVGVTPYTAKSGKEKLVLKGEPLEDFWQAWKALTDADKALLRAGGFRLACGRVAEPARTEKGRLQIGKPPRMRKAWRAELWINRRNKQAVMAAGFELPEIESGNEKGGVAFEPDADAVKEFNDAELCGAESVPF